MLYSIILVKYNCFNILKYNINHLLYMYDSKACFLTTNLKIILKYICSKYINILHCYILWMGLPRGHSGKIFYCRCRRCKEHGFNLWFGKIPWSGKWQVSPEFLPGKFHGQRCLVDHSPWDHKESDTNEWLSTQHILWLFYNLIMQLILEGEQWTSWKEILVPCPGLNLVNLDEN